MGQELGNPTDLPMDVRSGRSTDWLMVQDFRWESKMVLQKEDV
jgi:hypothetical protein